MEDYESSDCFVSSEGEWTGTDWTESFINGLVGPSPLPPEGIPLPTIFQVPKYIRKFDEAAYTPRVISIGPYHWKKIHEEKEDVVCFLRRFKRESVRFLLSLHGPDGGAAFHLLSRCLDMLNSLNQGIRSRYSTGNLPPSNRRLARMMLLDGCFIIGMLSIQYNLKVSRQSGGTQISLPHVMSPPMSPSTSGEKGDINEYSTATNIGPRTSSCPNSQAITIPKSHYSSDSEGTNLPKTAPRNSDEICEHLCPSPNHGAAQVTPPKSSRSPKTPPSRDRVNTILSESISRNDREMSINIDEAIPRSLLGETWMRKLVLYDLLKLENQIPFFLIKALLEVLGLEFELPLEEIVVNIFSEIQTISIPPPTPSTGYHHILHLYHSSLVSSISVEEPKINNGYSHTGIPSAVELQCMGMKFKKRTNYANFFDIRLKYDVMEIPPLRVCDYTSILFRNLIAFEQFCPNIKTSLMAYVLLMASLIDCAEDARLLGRCGIIKNYLNTDQAVADLFYTLKDGVPYSLDYALESHYLFNIWVGINTFRNEKRRLWNSFFDSHFWVYLKYFSFMIAYMALLINFMQFSLEIKSYNLQNLQYKTSKMS